MLNFLKRTWGWLVFLLLVIAATLYWVFSSWGKAAKVAEIVGKRVDLGRSLSDDLRKIDSDNREEEDAVLKRYEDKHHELDKVWSEIDRANPVELARRWNEAFHK
jgi:biopolymer transport protein ExbB/TolQ